jgi:hypothetical protein
MNNDALMRMSKAQLQGKLDDLDVAWKSSMTKPDLVKFIQQHEQRKPPAAAIFSPPIIVSGVAFDNVFQAGRRQLAAATAALPQMSKPAGEFQTPRAKSPARVGRASDLKAPAAAVNAAPRSKSPPRAVLARKLSPPPRPLREISSPDNTHVLSASPAVLFSPSPRLPNIGLMRSAKIAEDVDDDDVADDDDVNVEPRRAGRVLERVGVSRSASPSARQVPTSPIKQSRSVTARALAFTWSARWALVIGALAVAAAVVIATQRADWMEWFAGMRASSKCKDALATLRARRGEHLCDATTAFQLTSSELLGEQPGTGESEAVYNAALECLKAATLYGSNTGTFWVAESEAQVPFLCSVQLWARDNQLAIALLTLAAVGAAAVAAWRARVRARKRRVHALVEKSFTMLKAQKIAHRNDTASEPYIPAMHLRDALGLSRDPALWEQVLTHLKSTSFVHEKDALVAGAVYEAFEWIGA